MKSGKCSNGQPLSPVWRPPLYERIGLGCLSATFIFFSCAGIYSGLVERISDVLLWISFAFAGLIFGLYATLTSVALEGSELIVRNLGHRGVIPLLDVTSLHPGYYGTEIYCKRGKWWFALAVQQPRIAKWLGLRTRSDDMVKTVMAAVRKEQGCS